MSSVLLSVDDWRGLCISCRTVRWPCPHHSTVKSLCWWLKPIRSILPINLTVASYQRDSNRCQIHSLFPHVSSSPGISHSCFSLVFCSAGVLPCQCPSFGRISWGVLYPMGMATVVKVEASHQCPEPQRGLVSPCFNIQPPSRAYTLSQHALCHQGCKSRHSYWMLLVYHHDDNGT